MAGLAAGVNASMITLDTINNAFDNGNVELLKQYKAIFEQKGLGNLTNSERTVHMTLKDLIDKIDQAGGRRRKSKSRKHKKSKKARKHKKSKKAKKSRKH